MLTQAETDEMREDFVESLPDRARVLRATLIDDGQGGQVPGTPTVVFDGSCRLSPTWSGNETTAGGRLIAISGWYITLQALVTVYEKDTIEVTLLETNEVRTFEVTSTRDSRTYQIGTRVVCAELE